MTRVCFITTYGHNVGDDFVRDGIVHLVQNVLKDVRVELVHKHLPITARPRFSWLHSMGIDRHIDRLKPDLTLRVTRRIDNALPVNSSVDRIRSADMLIQSGGPIYWAGPKGDCANTEWWDPLIERRWIPKANGRPFFNIAGGTCQQYSSDASEFSSLPQVLTHIRRFFDLTSLTTLRDQLSVEVLRLAGRQAALLPCTSLFAVDRLEIAPKPGEYVVLNYMPTGGHFLLGEPVDAASWERRFVLMARKLAQRERVVLVCHDKKESEAARRLLPELESFRSDDYREYLRFYSQARWGLMNRVHGCFALASLGKPSAVVGSDSRARMVSQLGLPEVFVNKATEDWLETTCRDLESRTHDFPKTMTALKETAREQYETLIRRSLCSNGAGRS